MRGTSKHTTIEFGQGSPLTDITAYVTSYIALGGEGIFVDGTVYGSTGVINDAVGMNSGWHRRKRRGTRLPRGKAR